MAVREADVTGGPVRPRRTLMLRLGIAVATLATGLLAPCLAAAAPPVLSPSVVGEPPQGAGVLRFPQAVAVSPGGGTVFVGDQNSSVVQAFAPDGTPRFSVGFHASRHEPGRLGVVGGVATDRSGHLYVLDSENERVQVFSAADGHFLAQFGDVSVFDLLAGNPDTIAGGRSASGIAVAQPPGAPPVVYVADQGNDRVERFTLDPGTLQPTGAPQLSPASVELAAPQGIALDPGATHVYVADDDHHRVVVLDPVTLQLQGAVGGFGSGPGQLQNPYDVAVDDHVPSQLYVADNQNNRVDVFDAFSLGFLGTFGHQGYGPGVGNLAVVRSVGALTDVPGGGVDVADTANDRIQSFDSTGAVTSAWGLSGRGPGYQTDPRGVAIAPDGTIAVADAFDERIGLFAADGTWTGLRGQVSPSTGMATAGTNPGQFDLPGGVAYDAAGDLWVADSGNGRVQEIAPDGRVLRITPVADAAAVAPAPAGTYVAGRADGTVVLIAPDGAVSTVRSGLVRPAAVALAPDSTPFVAEEARVLNAATGALVVGPDGSTTWAQPAGLAFGPDGTLYIAERRPGTPNGARVVRGTPTGPGAYAWDTIATEGDGDGQVVEPGGVAVSADGGTVLVADTGNDRVVRLDAPGHHPPAMATLRVGVAGMERGSVVSDLPGIACVTDCRQRYGLGRAVTLTARALSGSIIAGWTGACAGAGTAPTCTVTMTGDQDSGVRFAAAPPPVPAPAPVPAPPPPPPVVLRSVRLTTHTLHRARPADRRRHRPARRATRSIATVALTRPAGLRVEVQQGRPGRRAGSSCLAPTRSNRRSAPCTRFVTIPRRRVLPPGATTVRFTVTPSFGATRPLAPGSYRLAVVAVDTSGNRVGPRTAAFRVAR
jgi:DNA-binding beta-propeller fold protein YncE